MTCKDCLHYAVCEVVRGRPNRVGKNSLRIAEKHCPYNSFLNKSEWIHPPCKVGGRVFSIVIIGGEYSVVADRVHALKISTENIYAETNWYVDGGEIGYNIFLTQEKAEKALAERRKK
jgi:hypothetical protein